MKAADLVAAYAPSSSPAARRGTPRSTSRRLSTRLRSRGVYDGTTHNRQTADWTAGDHEPPVLTTAWLEMLRNRSRSLARTAPHVVAAFRAIRDNVVGADGFRIRPRPRPAGAGVDQVDDRLALELRELWEEHSAAIDIDRRESLTSLLRTGTLEWPEAGEVFFVESTPRTDPDGSGVPQVVELVASERCDHALTSGYGQGSSVRIARDHVIRNGIEFDTRGRRWAYHFNQVDRYGLITNTTDSVRATRCHHLFTRLRAGQERGLPWLYATTMLAHDLDDLIDSELTSAQVAACLAAFVTSSSPEGPFQAAEDGSLESDAEDGRPVVGFDPGMVAYLEPGEEVSTVDPNRPSGTLEPFSALLLRLMSKAMGPSYETISGDYRRTNFASGRLAHLTERKAFRVMQDDTRDLVVRPIYRSFVRRAILAGMVSISPAEYAQNPRRFDRAVIQGPGWEHADPLKEVTAAAIRILVGLSTLDEESASLGRDWRQNIQQRTQEVRAMEVAGLPVITVGGAQPVQGMASAQSTARLHEAAKALGYTDAEDLVKTLEQGGAELVRANGGRIASLNGNGAHA